ncbi:MAG: hypothetical protein AAF663_03065 [Planctomycetota bacterium]
MSEPQRCPTRVAVSYDGTELNYLASDAVRLAVELKVASNHYTAYTIPVRISRFPPST